MDKKEIAKMIDHTLLKPEATEQDIINLCQEAKEHGFASVCINPVYVELAAEQLKGTGVMVCTVIGFPLGANTTNIKALEAEQAVAAGAQEVDMVINVGQLKYSHIQQDKDALEKVVQDIKSVVQAAQGRTVKVILETGGLTDQEKLWGCQAAVAAGAHFVKTSTGFGSGGATAADIKLMRAAVGQELGVKASGGVRSYEAALEMIQAGANRLGTSSGVAIVAGGVTKQGY